MNMQEITPAFQVEKYEGTYKQIKLHYKITYLKDENGEVVRDDDGRKVIASKNRIPVETEKPGGWMIYLPSGASLHVPTWQEMVRLGFHRAPGLVDEDGEPVPEMPQASLKDRVQSSTAPKRRARAATA